MSARGAQFRPDLFSREGPPRSPYSPQQSAPASRASARDIPGNGTVLTPSITTRSSQGLNRAGGEEKGYYDEKDDRESAPIGVPPVGDELIELEHVLGYSGRYRGTLISHPVDADLFLKAVGALLVVSNVMDPHAQRLLRGHDEDITAVAVSKTGGMVASGQLGSTHCKGYPAPVVIWCTSTWNALLRLGGLTRAVDLISFSPDGKFLAAAGQDGVLYIWDAGTGEVAYGHQYESAVQLLQWGGTNTQGRRPIYQMSFSVGNEGEVKEATFAFDPVRRQWNLDSQLMAVPASGLVRSYLCSGYMPPKTPGGMCYLLCGADVGDLVVFSLTHRVYRASVPVGAGGLLSICNDITDPNVIYCGSGDGMVRRMRGSDTRWSLDGETALDGPVITLTLSANGVELLAGTRAGSVWKILVTDSLTSVRLSSAHTAKITALSAGPLPEVIAAASEDGTVRIWELGSYSVISSPRFPKGLSNKNAANSSISADYCTALCWLGSDSVVSGWHQGGVICHTASGAGDAWSIPSAHRCAVTSVALHVGGEVAYLATGAADGTVRVWGLRSRALMLQFTEHQKGAGGASLEGRVSSLVVDNEAAHLLHSAGLDGSVFTYDLKRERRVGSHTALKCGGFTGLSQKTDGERELITCDQTGALLVWDCDAPDPVVCVSGRRVGGMGGPGGVLKCVAVSPSGRYVATCGEDGIVKILDPNMGGWPIVAEGRGHSATVTKVVWSSDEKQVISAGEDCTLCIWNFYG